MTIQYGFYNSINGDRKYNAEQMSSIFNGIINDGIFMSIGDTMIVSQSTSMNVQIGTGRAWFNSTWTNIDSTILLAIDQSEIAFDRIDIVVLEINSTEDVRANSIKVVKGVPSLTPVAPTLTNTEFIHQYSLAEIYIAAEVTEILTANITNKVGTAPCPFVTGILDTIDTTALVAQWNGEFDVWLNNIQTLLSESSDEFDVWFATIQDILNESVAGNLLDLINTNTANLTALETSITTITIPQIMGTLSKIRRGGLAR